ncbi:Similar to Anaphase-promoting complex subunit 11; acc. no. Q9UT86 [Pyronema omphalodes CBS 100304]|uniref:Similar to Anaphase-promoting complex subunit 11 acc. no. Q9UT86 n=1 Tax=Pyronema omphalodes (strain CBS 100304) TaxID=1076935 RepID=U4L072_PYROM|nr:Similar to Anaphase-promoting complex subunit 11; acc. no. Q9UT86 [Pyronema omphalodes CBS 100304]
MKVKIKSYTACAAWRWDVPEDDVCGICRVQFDGTCPNCRYPGDDCPFERKMRPLLSSTLRQRLDPDRKLSWIVPDVQAEI